VTLSQRVKEYIEHCTAIAEDLPEPYRGQALAVIAQQPNWPDEFQRIVEQVLEQS
jgi:hypothetical protein